jgi:hypothetical protein
VLLCLLCVTSPCFALLCLASLCLVCMLACAASAAAPRGELDWSVRLVVSSGGRHWVRCLGLAWLVGMFSAAGLLCDAVACFLWVACAGCSVSQCGALARFGLRRLELPCGEGRPWKHIWFRSLASSGASYSFRFCVLSGAKCSQWSPRCVVASTCVSGQCPVAVTRRFWLSFLIS